VRHRALLLGSALRGAPPALVSTRIGVRLAAGKRWAARTDGEVSTRAAGSSSGIAAPAWEARPEVREAWQRPHTRSLFGSFFQPPPFFCGTRRAKVSFVQRQQKTWPQCRQ
jgi:hypothetical protein